MINWKRRRRSRLTNAALLLRVAAVGLVGCLTPPVSGALSVGTNINVTKLAGNQTETTIAINPVNPQNLFVAANGGSFPTPGVFYYSTNGGTNWASSDVSSLPASCCDESASWDDFGNLFLTYLTTIGSTAIVALSTNGGASFSLLFQSEGSIDQPTVVCGPGGTNAPGSVWVTYASGSGLAANGAAVYGFGAVGIFSTNQIAPGPGGSYGDIAVGPNGQVMVTYQNPTGGTGPATIYINVDPDGLGPLGFDAAVIATDTRVGGLTPIPAQPQRTIDAEAGLAWDRSGGPRFGRVYLVYTDRPSTTSADTDIYVRYSDNEGAAWSAPTRVNDDPPGKSQFLPRIALDQTTGNIAVSFYDCRDSTVNSTAEFWASVSLDGTASFWPNVKASRGMSNANVPGPGAFDFGDYTGLAFHGETFYPCWGDNSNSTSNNPDGTLTTLDVYTVAIRLPPTPPFLTIALASSNTVIVFWAAPSTGFILQENAGLEAAGWTNVAAVPVVVGNHKLITIPAPSGQRFYRLVHP